MSTPMQLVQEFRKGSDPGAFTKISRSDVADGLEKIVKGTAAISQRGASLCGPAAFLYCVSKDKPADYVNYVTGLYETGEAKLGTLAVKPGSSLKGYKPPKGKIRPADWIALASLRDSENAVFNYDEITDEFAGISLPSALEGWFKSAGYSQVKQDTGVWFHEGQETLTNATGAFNQGKRVCLFISAGKLMDEKKVKKNSSFPDHWVVLTKAPNVTKTTIGLSVFTWGSEKYAIPQTGTLKLDHFLEHFYGYVAAKA